jgi:glycosyltransferase involved in cell wall biosynthesis
LLIAYNYYLPIIASDLEFFKEMVIDGENGFLFEQNNILELINCFNKALLLSENEFRMMKERMFHISESYKLKSNFAKELNEFMVNNLK